LVKNLPREGHLGHSGLLIKQVLKCTVYATNDKEGTCKWYEWTQH